ncbi:12886_t:CDS:2 [Racocetra fulgida]|uniref:12886_t:CDS:1 n=1 Tax=Racocetra fulgida TaxID=60492 RepID=A0A9N9A035_9GLOM|nr:12886_t:CDS:2 [Racocetra fulgida]
MELGYADPGHPQPANKVEDTEVKSPTFPTTQELSTSAKKESSPLSNIPPDMPSQGPPSLVNGDDRGRDRESGASRPRARSRSPRPRSYSQALRAGVSLEEKEGGGVFNLSLRTTEKDLQAIFERYGRVNQVTIVYDHRSDRSRGFGFVYMNSVEEASVAKEKTNGMELNGRNMRVDYSLTQRPHTPTPGEYMGDRPSRFRGNTYQEERLHALEVEAGQGIEEDLAAVVIRGVEEGRIAALKDLVVILVEKRSKRVNETLEIRIQKEYLILKDYNAQ